MSGNRSSRSGHRESEGWDRRSITCAPLRLARTGAFFAENDPVEVVEAVRATSDEQLLKLTGRDDVRPLAVAVIVSRMHEYAIPERLAEIEGVVRFDLERRGELLERHGLVFDRGTLKHLPEIRGDEQVDVVLRTSALRFIRLVSGRGTPALSSSGHDRHRR